MNALVLATAEAKDSMTDMITLINSLGLPLAAVIILGLYLKMLLERQYTDFREREGALLKANEEFSKVLSETSRRLDTTLIHHKELEEKMDKAESGVDELNAKLKEVYEKVTVIDNKVSNFSSYQI